MIFFIHLVFGYDLNLIENSATKFILVAHVPHHFNSANIY